MPFFRYQLPKIDSAKSSFRFDNNSLSIYLRNLLSSSEEKQSNNDETQKIQTDINNSIRCNWQKSIQNHQCPFFKFNENYMKIRILDQCDSNEKSNDNNSRTSKHQFDFDSISIRLLETFGFLGTAIVVGFDIRSRINQWSPVQHHREHNKHELIINNNQNSNNKIIANHNQKFCHTKLFYCGSCNWCKYIFNKLFVKPSIFPSFITLNVIEQTKINKQIIEKNENNLLTNDYYHNKIKQIFDLSSDVEPICVEFFEDNKNERKSINNIVEQQSYFVGTSIHNQQNKCKIDNIYEDDKDDDDDEDDDEDDDDDDYNDDDNDDSDKKNNDITSLVDKILIKYCDTLNNLSGIKLIKKKNRINDALSCWLSCEQRNPSALFNLGVTFENGIHNNKKDLNKAFKYYLLAAQNGHPQAIYNIALYYLYGKNNIKPDIKLGLKLLRLASNNGIKQATDYLKLFNEKKLNIQFKKRQKLNRSLSTPSILLQNFTQNQNNISSLQRSLSFSYLI